jgi:hypothetical protein
MRTLRFTTLLSIVAGVTAAAACGSSDSSGGGAGSPSGPSGSGTASPAAPVAPGGAGGGGAGGGGSHDGETPETPIPYVAFDVNHVVSTGQSNSVSHGGIPVLTTTQPFTNLSFDVGVMTSGDCEREGCRAYQKPSTFIPLTEGDSFWYPVETMSSGLANEGTLLAKNKYGKTSHDILVSLAGRNGLTYWCLRKGGCNFIDPTYVNSFDESLRQVADAKAIAAASGKSYVVRVVTSVHGESDDFAYATKTQEFPLDGTDGSPQTIKSYEDGLLEWQRDFEANIRTLTGQTQAVPLFISQFSGWNDIATSTVAQFQYQAHVESKGKVVIVTPGYALEWGPDCRHYSNNGERRLGEYFGKAYARTVFEGRRWEPLRPTKVTRAGATITAKFVVPVPPLVLDTQRIVDPGSYGFEVVDAAGASVAIASVALAGPDTVTIGLAGAPAGALRLRYAYTAVPQTCPGATAGPRGNLRDSDASPSQYGYELFNWSVHFDVPVE